MTGADDAGDVAHAESSGSSPREPREPRDPVDAHERRAPRIRSLRDIATTVLLDPAITRPGYLFATAVGLTWGFLWSTGPVRKRNGLFVFTGLPQWAFGRGGICVGSCYMTATNAGGRVLEHEAVHKQQWQRYGMWFPLLYGIAGRDPLKNRFEIEAGLEKGGYR